MPQGKLEPVTWEHALRVAGAKLKEVRDSRGGAAIGVIGSNHTTNEENYLLQKFARTVLRTNNIDHERTTDYAAFAQALAGHEGKAASLRDIASAPAILLIGGNPTDEHPLLAWDLRTNVRLNRARLYVANAKQIKLERQAKAALRIPVRRLLRPGLLSFPATTPSSTMPHSARQSSQKNRCSSSSVRSIRGSAVAALVQWGLKRANVRFAYLGDYANSRGAADMGLLPDRLPGYVPVRESGSLAQEYPGIPPHTRHDTARNARRCQRRPTRRACGCRRESVSRAVASTRRHSPTPSSSCRTFS